MPLLGSVVIASSVLGSCSALHPGNDMILMTESYQGMKSFPVNLGQVVIFLELSIVVFAMLTSWLRMLVSWTGFSLDEIVILSELV